MQRSVIRERPIGTSSSQVEYVKSSAEYAKVAPACAALHPGYRSGGLLDPFLAYIEGSALSDWIRSSESIFAFPAIITLHTIGMGFLAGGSAAIDLSILGVAPGISLKAMG